MPIDLSVELSVWWFALCTVTVINIAAWCISSLLLEKHRTRWPLDAFVNRRRLLWLSAFYVLGCGFRSVFPMIEVQRACLYDIWISRAAITRSVATVAEFCFVAQWVLLLREAGTNWGSRRALRVSKLLFPIIVFAELSCWCAVISGNYLLHAIENSLWTLAALLALTALIELRSRGGNTVRRFLTAAIVCNVGYIAFMVLVDVPMYWSRWQPGGPSRPLSEGFHLLVQRCAVKTDWTSWREDAVWLSLYFTIAVWTSLALPHIPPFRQPSRPRT